MLILNNFMLIYNTFWKLQDLCPTIYSRIDANQQSNRFCDEKFVFGKINLLNCLLEHVGSN